MGETDRGAVVGGAFNRGNLWPVVLGLSAIVAWFVTVSPEGASFRNFVLLWFLLVCPGMAVVRLVSLRDALSEWTLAVSLSILLDMTIAIAQLYGGGWSPADALIGLAVITLAFSALAAIGWRVASPQHRSVRAIEAKANVRVPQPSQGPRTWYSISKPLIIVASFLVTGAGIGVVAQMRIGWVLDPRAGLTGLIETVRGEQLETIAIAVVALLGVLLVESDLELALGAVLPPKLAGFRIVVIGLLIVVFGMLISLRVACLANPAFCSGEWSTP